MSDVMKKCCANCPYSTNTKPFLTENRQIELADLSTNPYNYFPCHKTLDSDDEGETIVSIKSKVCHGFHVMQAEYNDNGLDDGITRDDACFGEPDSMVEYYYENTEVG